MPSYKKLIEVIVVTMRNDHCQFFWRYRKYFLDQICPGRRVLHPAPECGRQVPGICQDKLFSIFDKNRRVIYVSYDH